MQLQAHEGDRAVNEIVVPGVPDLPPPPETLLRTECERCKERGERYERAAAGNGTIDEIREAITALENAKALQLPFGVLVMLGHGRHKVKVCPRCTNVGTVADPVPLIEKWPRLSRDERRRFILK